MSSFKHRSYTYTEKYGKKENKDLLSAGLLILILLKDAVSDM
jgi:hypothetical protein